MRIWSKSEEKSSQNEEYEQPILSRRNFALAIPTSFQSSKIYKNNFSMKFFEKVWDFFEYSMYVPY